MEAVLRSFFHAWERYLASVSKDRVVRPFEANEQIVAKNVTENLYARHLRPLFVG